MLLRKGFNPDFKTSRILVFEIPEEATNKMTVAFAEPYLNHTHWARGIPNTTYINRMTLSILVILPLRHLYT